MVISRLDTVAIISSFAASKDSVLVKDSAYDDEGSEYKSEVDVDVEDAEFLISSALSGLFGGSCVIWF